MSELSTSTLFDPSTTMPPAAPEVTNREEKRSEKLAKEFVRWCFSFGSDFRNTPDVVNLRTWAQKTKLKLKGSEEQEILVESRRIYLKRIEQMMKKSDTPMIGAEPDAGGETDSGA